MSGRAALAAGMLLAAGAGRAVPPASPAAPPSAAVPAAPDWPQPVGDGIHDDGAALAALLATQRDVELPPGIYLVGRTLVLRGGTQLRGAGMGVTILRLAAGTNRNLLESERFDELAGTARLADAPADISISGVSLDGGFLSANWNDPARLVRNVRGSCLALYAKRVHVDLEASNCAEHMLYSEGQGPRNAEEVASTYRIQGLTAGEECVVFRGPGDSRFDRLSVGVCGAKLQQPSLAEIRSTLYPEDEGIDGIVVDRRSPYEGTVEMDFAHVFASFSGWGLRTRGNPRFSAMHLVSESNLGGVLIDEDSWGAISVLDVHSNGASVGTPAPAARAALWLQSKRGFSLAQATIARTASGADGYVAARIDGTGSNVTLTLLTSRNTATQRDFRGTGVLLSGTSNVLRLTALRMTDEAVVISGDDNLVEVATDGVVRNLGQHNTISGRFGSR